MDRMSMLKCHKCYKPIPSARLKALPNTKECVTCSTEEQNMVRAVISGKTTYSEVEVIKNKQTKEYLKKLVGRGRRGFGSMLYRGSRREVGPKNVRLGKSMPIHRQPTKEDFDKIGKQVMQYLDLGMTDKADRIMNESLENRFITGTQYRQLKEIIKHIDNG